MGRRLVAAAVAAAVALLGGCAGRAPLHPAFTLAVRDLDDLVVGLAPEEAARVRAEPARFLALAAAALDAPAGVLVLVDKHHGLEDGWQPDDLVELDPRTLALTRRGLRLRAPAAADLEAMSAAARADGVSLPVSSAWRSAEYQAELWERALATLPAEEVEATLARAGHSQHQLGTAVDFGTIDLSFARTAASAWLAANAWRFGWSLSFPPAAEAQTGYSWEPWHYRWLGREAAEMVRGFFGDSQQRFLEFWDARSSLLRQRRKRQGVSRPEPPVPGRRVRG